MSNAPYRKITLVLQNGAQPEGHIPPLEPWVQPICFAQWEDGEVHFDFLDSSRQSAPIPEGGELQLTVRRFYYSTGSPPISSEATITNPDGGEDCGYFPIGSGNTGAMEPAVYSVNAVYTDPDGVRWACLPDSPWLIMPSAGQPGTPVDPPIRTPPLGLGPSGAKIAQVASVPGATLTHSGVYDIDQVTPSSGWVCFDKDNPVETLRGLWVIGPGPWTRAPNATHPNSLQSGMPIVVMFGDRNGSTQWALTNLGVITPGTTPLTVEKFDSGKRELSGLDTSALSAGRFAYLSAPGVASPTDAAMASRSYVIGCYEGVPGSVSVGPGDAFEVAFTTIGGEPVAGLPVWLAQADDEFDAAGKATATAPETGYTAQVGICVDATNYLTDGTAKILFQPKLIEA